MSPVCKMARKCSTAQGPHSEVVPRAFWRLVLKSCDECKGSFARGCEAKQWSHWMCSSLGTIFQPMRINSVPDVKCFCNNKNVLCVKSVVWHFVRHPVYSPILRCHSVTEIKTLLFLYKTGCFVKKSVHIKSNSKIGENLAVYTYMQTIYFAWYEWFSFHIPSQRAV